MTVMEQIRRLAAQLAEQAQNRTSRLEREICELVEQTAKKRAELTTANLAHKRLTNFQVWIESDYQCPRCWIEHETQSALTAIGGGTDTEDLLRCSTCSYELSVKIGM
jgi:hypothetical protein